VHTHIHIYIYICVYIYRCINISLHRSGCRGAECAAGTGLKQFEAIIEEAKLKLMDILSGAPTDVRCGRMSKTYRNLCLIKQANSGNSCLKSKQLQES
jgi:hypothetical protein